MSLTVEGHSCAFYVKAKQRYCKFPPSGDHGFCPTHAPLQKGTRIFCPIDPSHSIHESKLARHALGCTRVRDLAWELLQPFVSENVNVEQLSADAMPLPELFAARGCQSVTGYDDFVKQRAERSFPHKDCSPTDRSSPLQPPSLPAGDEELQTFHRVVDTVYRTCCDYLNIPSEFFLKGFNSSEPPARDTIQQRPTDDTFVSGETEKVLSELLAEHPSIQNVLSDVLISGCHDDVLMRPTSTEAASSCNGAKEDPPPARLPTKHDLQNAALLVTCLNLGYISAEEPPPLHPLLCIEFGAGRGALTRWFGAFLRNQQQTRYVLIDREKRRNVTEAKTSGGSIDQFMAQTRVLRLRADIKDFDLGSLLSYSFLKPPFVVAGEAAAAVQPSFTTVPLLIQYLARLGCLSIPHPPPASSLDRSNRPSVDSNSIIRTYLQRFSGPAGNARLDALYDRVSRSFSSNVLLGESYRSAESKGEFACLCIAKHLCGGATDVALRCIRKALSSIQRTSTPSEVSGCLRLVIATCCHHRTTWTASVGQKWLNTRFGFTADVFHQWINLCGWATGAHGVRQLIGVKIKRIIDTARVVWLREHGFPDATLRSFISPGQHTTLEHVVLTASTLHHATIVPS